MSDEQQPGESPYGDYGHWHTNPDTYRVAQALEQEYEQGALSEDELETEMGAVLDGLY